MGSKQTTEQNLRYTLKKKYGITPEQFYELLASQGGVCSICQKTCATGTRLSQDHDHDSGRNRGLLCRNCNAGLGNFKDDPELLERALHYLAAWT